MHIRKTLLAAALAATSFAAIPWTRALPQQTQEQPRKQPPRSLVPDTFTNLNVLPKDIAKADLVRIMRQFCFVMDQRCSYCHVATDDLSQADFAADAKEPKKKARELLKYILDTQKKAAASSEVK